MSNVIKCDRLGCEKEIPEGEGRRICLLISKQGPNPEDEEKVEMEIVLGDACPKCTTEIEKLADNGFRIKRKKKVHDKISSPKDY